MGRLFPFHPKGTKLFTSVTNHSFLSLPTIEGDSVSLIPIPLPGLSVPSHPSTFAITPSFSGIWTPSLSFPIIFQITQFSPILANISVIPQPSPATTTLSFFLLQPNSCGVFYISFLLILSSLAFALIALPKHLSPK